MKTKMLLIVNDEQTQGKDPVTYLEIWKVGALF